MTHDDPFAGKTVDANWAYYLDTPGTYTPALTAVTTDPDLGADGEASGSWQRNGHLITAWVRINFSGAGVDAGSGIYEISLPFDADTSTLPDSPAIGSGVLFDTSTSANRQPVAVSLASVSVVRLRPTGGTFVTDSSPFTWADGDNFLFCVSYLADSTDLPT